MEKYLAAELAAHPQYLGDILPNEDQTLTTRGAGKGLKLYDELRRDTRARSVLDKRIMAVIVREWAVYPASDSALDVAAADFVRGELKRIAFDDLCLSLLDAILKGFAVSEVMWEDDGFIRVRETKARHQSRFVFDLQGQPRLLSPTSGPDGIPLPERKFIVHRTPASDNSPYGDALGSALFWSVFFKKAGKLAWMDYLEKFAQPIPKGEYSPGAQDAEKNELLQQLQAIRTRRVMIVPKGTPVELLESKRSGGSEAFEAFVRYEDEQMAEVTLGETLTTNIQGQGSRAATETHDSIRLEKAKMDADRLCQTLNKTLLTWLTELNFPKARPPQVWRMFPKDLLSQAERDAQIVAMGFEPSEKYVQETYGGEWKSKPLTPSVPRFGESHTHSFVDVRDQADAVSEQLERHMTPLAGNVLERVQALIQTSNSFEEVEAGLLDLYGMDLSAAGALMRNGMLNANLAGRVEVLDEG